jgi:hypothetical protein
MLCQASLDVHYVCHLNQSSQATLWVLTLFLFVDLKIEAGHWDNYILIASDGAVTSMPPDNARRQTLATIERVVPFGKESKIVCGSVDGRYLS